MMKTTFRSVFLMAPVAALLLLVVLQLAVPGHAQPPPGTVQIQGFSYNGDGCPVGTAAGTVSKDGMTLTVIFGQFTATTDKKVTDMRKSCQVTVQLKYPSGYVFTMGDVTMRGYANLQKGVEATVQTSYYVSGLVGTAKATRRIYGVFDDIFEFTDTFQNVVSSSCGKLRNLELNLEVRVKPGKPPRSGIVTFDSQDLKITQRYRLIWKKC